MLEPLPGCSRCTRRCSGCSACTAACGATRACPTCSASCVAVGLAAIAVPALLCCSRLGALVPRSVFCSTPLLLMLVMAAAGSPTAPGRNGACSALVAKPQASRCSCSAPATRRPRCSRSSAQPQWRVVGLLDDDARKHGRPDHGVKVLGPHRRRRRRRRAPRRRRRRSSRCRARRTQCASARSSCARAAGSAVMTVPRSTTSSPARSACRALRHVELDDLLGRDPVELDDARAARACSTASACWSPAPAARSARSCAARSRASRRARLVLFDLSEFALYAIEQEFRDRLPAASPWPRSIGDVKDARRVRRGVRALPAGGRVPRRGLQARAADGGATTRGRRCATTSLGTVVAGARGAQATAREVRAGLDRQGGEPDQRDGRDQAPRRDGLPGAAAGQPRRSSSWCASATCSAAPAA